MPKPITAAGGVVYQILPDAGIQVLLIFRNGVWDLPKGKLEKKESIPMCAVREVAEETGSGLPLLVSELGTTYHEYWQGNTLFGKTTWWFSMVFSQTETLKPQIEEGISNIEWVELHEAMEKVGYANLVEVLRRFSTQV